ncbi:hypothetical protein SPRG_01216 [Saprolegnia parasitica CBS 223.65]|uniref:Uncharacterized protein n=1 Tax=Saprolegnia parasitica (strain CBS 223.65) TaxID=695850 RepID=A0A067CWR9_SAPPC|nr:hypothetical protein SPRG_01216 [Saprolegnia parasitica CBS 223.65]KDO35149.1 hypothetical protein SPRG_01216 [Saprolegnia parasitica CBS 223.65]|eukprot:XP_012194796.1 hypothetical protein SPRG_01216 [Saprolegnia parasitica CBS 223.65]
MPRFGSTLPAQVEILEIDIAALDHLVRTDNTTRVLRSRDLVRAITAYQRGYDEISVTLLAILRRMYLPRYDLHDSVPEAFVHLRHVLPWWLAKHQPDLVSCLPIDVRAPLLCYAMVHGHMGLLETLVATDQLHMDELHWDLLGRHGHLKVLQFLVALGVSGPLHLVLANAAVAGHLSMVAYLHDTSGVPVTSETLILACVFGRIEVAQYAHDVADDGIWDPETVDCAARRGHLNIVRFLHQFDYDGFSSRTMDVAAEHGHLEVVRFLHEHRFEGCSAAAMLGAVRCGHLEVVMFLDLHRPDAATDNAVVVAMQHGQERVIAYFQEERKLKKRFSRIQKKVAVLVRSNDSMRHLYHGPKTKLCSA